MPRFPDWIFLIKIKTKDFLFVEIFDFESLSSDPNIGPKENPIKIRIMEDPSNHLGILFQTLFILLNKFDNLFV